MSSIPDCVIYITILTHGTTTTTTMRWLVCYLCVKGSDVNLVIGVDGGGVDKGRWTM